MLNKTLHGKYLVKNILGTGGMGLVYNCVRKDIGDEVAIKILTHHIEGKELLNEARAAGLSSHGNICKIYDYFEEDGQSYLVMEKLDGLDLAKFLQVEAHLAKRLSFRCIFGIIRETAYALQHAHKQVLHRDIKPANIFLTRHGDVKVLDFGISKLLSAHSFSQSHACTEAYSSPELWKNGRYDASEYDASNDLYSLGLVFYELIQKKQVFIKHPSPEQLSISNVESKLPDGMERLFARWTSPKKQDRYKSADDLLAALNEIYPQDFNLRIELQAEVEIAMAHINGSRTLKDHSPILSRKQTIKKTVNSWLMVSVFAAIVLSVLGYEYSQKINRYTGSHEEQVQNVRKALVGRDIASQKQ